MPRVTPQPAEATASAPVAPLARPAAAKSRKNAKRRMRGISPMKQMEAQFEARVQAEVLRRIAKPIDGRKFEVGQDKPRDLPVDGPARLSEAEIEPVLGVFSKEYLEMLMFMEEKVIVRVQTTPDKNADPNPGFWVNGISQYFPRGVSVTCRRKFIEQLARSRTTSYTQEEYIDAKGNKAIRNIPSTSLNYPFQVMRDDNPDGPAWLEKVLSEA